MGDPIIQEKPIKPIDFPCQCRLIFGYGLSQLLETKIQNFLACTRPCAIVPFQQEFDSPGNRAGFIQLIMLFCLLVLFCAHIIPFEMLRVKAECQLIFWHVPACYEQLPIHAVFPPVFHKHEDGVCCTCHTNPPCDLIHPVIPVPCLPAMGDKDNGNPMAVSKILEITYFIIVIGVLTLPSRFADPDFLEHINNDSCYLGIIL